MAAIVFWIYCTHVMIIIIMPINIKMHTYKESAKTRNLDEFNPGVLPRMKCFLPRFPGSAMLYKGILNLGL